MQIDATESQKISRRRTERRTVRLQVALTPTEWVEAEKYMLETDSITGFATRCILRAIRSGAMGKPLGRRGSGGKGRVAA